MGKLTMKQLMDRREKYDVYQQIVGYEKFKLEFMPLLETIEILFNYLGKEQYKFGFYGDFDVYEVEINKKGFRIQHRYQYNCSYDSAAYLSFKDKEETCLDEFNNSSISIETIKKLIKRFYDKYLYSAKSQISCMQDTLKALGFKDLETDNEKELARVEKTLTDVREENVNLIMSHLDRANHGASQYKEQYEDLLTKIDEMFGEGVGKAIEDGKFVAVSVQEYNGLRKE